MNVAEVLGQLAKIINGLDSSELVIIAGILTSSAHYLLNHFKSLDKLKNVLVSFGLPLVTAVFVVLLHDGNVSSKYPEIYLTAQACYGVVEAIKRAAQKQLQV